MKQSAQHLAAPVATAVEKYQNASRKVATEPFEGVVVGLTTGLTSFGLRGSSQRKPKSDPMTLP